MVNKIWQFYVGILKFLNQNKDKQLHAFYCYFISMWFYTFSGLCLKTFIFSSIYIIVFGLIKQYLDKKITETFSNGDMVANITGWGIATVHAYIILVMSI